MRMTSPVVATLGCHLLSPVSRTWIGAIVRRPLGLRWIPPALDHTKAFLVAGRLAVTYRAETALAAGLDWDWTERAGARFRPSQFVASPGPFFRHFRRSGSGLSALWKRPGAHLSARGWHTASSQHTPKCSNVPAAVLFSAPTEDPAAARSNRNRPSCPVLFIMVFHHKLTDQKLTNKLMGKPGVEGQAVDPKVPVMPQSSMPDPQARCYIDWGPINSQASDFDLGEMATISRVLLCRLGCRAAGSSVGAAPPLAASWQRAMDTGCHPEAWCRVAWGETSYREPSIVLDSPQPKEAKETEQVLVSSLLKEETIF